MKVLPCDTELNIMAKSQEHLKEMMTTLREREMSQPPQWSAENVFKRKRNPG